MDPFSGVPIVIDMYTFPGSGFITVDLVVYLKKKESSVEDNTIFYDTVREILSYAETCSEIAMRYN
jgi:hypothetical protein